MPYKLKQKYFVVEYGPRADLEFCFQFLTIFLQKSVNLRTSQPVRPSVCI